MNDNTLYHELYDFLCTIPTVDAHEHLPGPAESLKRKMDFYSLFEHYCQGDLVAAGASDADLAFWRDRDKPLTARWERFKPFFSAIRTGSYARAALLYIRDVLGFEDLTDGTVEAISQRLVADNVPGHYDRILKERCNLIACVECWEWPTPEPDWPDYFYYLEASGEFVDVHQNGRIRRLETKYNVAIHTLNDVLHLMSVTLGKWAKTPKLVGIKSAHAYERTLKFEKRTFHEAEVVFNRLLTAPGGEMSQGEAQPLQDYLMYQLVARAEAVGIPMVFHTGLQAGNNGCIEDANPLLLRDLLDEFQRAKIDLFHAGMPWVREIAVLAKYFQGVHLNMAWSHIISPTQSRSALSEWLDMVPNTKIFGFGGDYAIVEKVYGHLKLARQDVARVLADKVVEGAFTRAEAEMVGRRLMFENARRFYNLPIEE